MRHIPLFVLVFLVALLGGCDTIGPRVEFNQPMTAKPEKTATRPAEPTGSIYQDAQAVAYRPLFEDKRARYVGDTITIVVSENFNATQKANTKVERTDSIDTSITSLNNIPVFGGSFLRNVLGLTADASGSNKLDGKGESNNANSITGVITCTVVEVLPNGNLIVAGEKQIGTNHEIQMVRFSGVVNPSTVVAGNRVASNQVADARLEYRGRGQVDSAQVMGWLARFFLSFMPF